RGRRGCRVPSPPRDDARIFRPQAPGGGRGGGRRRAMHRLLLVEMPAGHRRGSLPAAGLARMDGPGDRQHPRCPSALPDASGRPPRTRSRHLRGLVLDHAGDNRRCAMAGDPGSARRLLDDSAVVADHLDDFPARISLLQARALDGFFQGDIETVKSAAAEGVRLGREVGDLYSLEMMLLNAGGTALITGDLEQAKGFYTEALRIARRIDDRVAEYALLDGLGCVAAGSGQARMAAQLIGAAETIRIQAGASLIPILAPLIEQAEASAVAALGQSQFDSEMEA